MNTEGKNPGRNVSSVSESSDVTPLAGLTVLLVAMYYFPEATGSAPYTTDVARRLAQRGAAVHVIASPPHYPSWRRWADYRNRWGTELVDGVQVHRVPIYVPRNPTIAKRSLYELSFLAAAAPIGISFKPDIVVGTSPSLFGAALAEMVAKIRHVPLIQLVQDVVSAAPGQTAQSTDDGPATRILAKIEGRALRSAAAVTVPTDAFRPALVNLGMSGSRIRTIPNWSRLTPYKIDREAERARLGWGGRFVILHTGNIGHKQSLHRLAPAIEYVGKRERTVSFCFLGAGNQLGQLHRSTQGLSNVTIQHPVPDAEYFATLHAADVLLVHEAPSVRNVSLPSKLTAYFAAGQPVLAVTQDSGATAEEIAKSRAGVIVPHDEGPQLCAGIRHLMNSRDLRYALAGNGRTYWQEKLSSERGLAQLQELILTNARAV